MSEKEGLIINNISFTKRELDIIACLINGRSYKEAARILGISPRTVESHFRNIMNVSACTNRKELIDFISAADKRQFFDNLFKGFVGESDLPQHITHQKKQHKKNIKILIAIAVVSFISFIGIKEYYSLKKSEKITENLYALKDGYLKRNDILKSIKEVFKKQKGIKTAVIVGVGGSGKTTISREFLKESDADITWEINAESLSSIEKSFFKFATVLAKKQNLGAEFDAIKNTNDIEERHERLLMFITSILKTKDWCLLFDNVEDFSTIKPYFPYDEDVWGKGILLITTRNKNLVDATCIDKSAEISIPKLSKAEKHKLFSNIIGPKNLANILPEKLDNFLKALPSHPLDVSMAAYYLKNSHIELDHYLKMTQEISRNFEKVQIKLLEESINYSKTRYGIVSSIFEKILNEDPNFKELLFFICIINSQDIPKILLTNSEDSATIDDFIYNLKKHSIIIDRGEKFAIHRSTQNIGHCFLKEIISETEREIYIKKFIASLTPYEKLSKTVPDVSKVLLHLKSILEKADFSALKNQKIDLLLTIGDIYRFNELRTDVALKYYKEALRLNQNYLNSYEEANIKLKMAEICTLISEDDEALSYLQECLEAFKNHIFKLATVYKLMGITERRKDNFETANKYFKEAISILKNRNDANFIKSQIYAEMAFNYFMKGVNRGPAVKSVEIMQHAINFLKIPKNVKEKNFLVILKTRLSGIYNALGKYALSIKEGEEALKLIKDLKKIDSHIYRAQGIILREKALSYLRLNRVSEAYDYFLNAKEKFSQTLMREYLYRLKMHEIEALIRLNRFDEALRVCYDLFSMKNREKNNYCDLFFYTCYYHAAYIMYKKQDIKASLDYFEKFFISMNELSKKLLTKEAFDELVSSKVFEPSKDLKVCFEKSLKIFEAIYWKDYEFTKYYVEEHLKNLK